MILSSLLWLLASCGLGEGPREIVSSATGERLARSSQAARRLVGIVERARRDGDVIGCQLAIGNAAGVLVERCLGTVSANDRRAVSPLTQFCIGSCSKPVDTACIMALVDDGVVDLDAPVDRWLPQAGRLRLRDGTPAARAPTVRELMCHRGGFFSQFEDITEEQARMVYSFGRPLAEAVDEILNEPLAATPGERFAYSAAGYMVLGRVAEVASGKDYGRVLGERICDRLGLSSTTYFPFGEPETIAVGTMSLRGEIVDHVLTPHLAGPALRLSLIGGGIYSTARDLGRFARMMISRGRHGSVRVLSTASWQELVRRQPFEQGYGLGWELRRVDDRGVASRVSHEGAIASNRSFLTVDLDSGHYAVVLYTISDPRDRSGPRSTEAKVKRQLRILMTALADEA